MKKEVNILFVGDIVGKLGRKICKNLLPEIKKKYSIDFTIANGENSAAGYGITEKVYQELTDTGINVITMGNHMFDKRDFSKNIDACPTIIRPANYPENTPGKDHLIVDVKGIKIATINLLGRVFMHPMDCPFKIGESLIEKIKNQTPIIIVDMHAEATSEKCALGYFFDGKVTAVLGTHTHVMTADEKIMEKGTAYICDVGITGAYDSIIGMDKEAIITRFLTQMPHRFEPVTEGKGLFNAVVIKVDVATGKAKEIKRIYEIIPSTEEN